MNRRASWFALGLIASSVGCYVRVDDRGAQRPVARSAPPPAAAPAPAPAPPPPPGRYAPAPAPPPPPGHYPAYPPGPRRHLRLPLRLRPRPPSRSRTRSRIPLDNSWSLREKEQWRDLAKDVQSSLNYLNKACGTNIGGAFVYESFRGRFVASQYGGVDYLPNFSSAPFNALTDICGETEVERNSVRRRITGIVISWTTAAASSFSMSGTILQATVNPRDNTGASAYQYRVNQGVRNYL